MEITFLEAEFLAMLIDQQLKMKINLLATSAIDLVAIQEFLGNSINKSIYEINEKEQEIKSAMYDMFKQMEALRERIKNEYGI